MSGIRINAAAEMLGVSTSTLRSWERRLGYPQPHRTPGNHRLYELDEVEALREALRETHNISSAVEVARQRGRGPASPARLVAAFDRFDEAGADRQLEESLAVRSVERSISELLLPALELAERRANGGAELEYACRWATGWLHRARRLAPGAARDEGVLLLDSGSPLGRRVGPRPGARAVPAPRRPARAAALRRARRGSLPQRPAGARAVRGRDLRLRGAPRRARRPAAGAARRRRRRRPLGYRAARLVSGRDGVPSLGVEPAEATDALLARLG